MAIDRNLEERLNSLTTQTPEIDAEPIEGVESGVNAPQENVQVAGLTDAIGRTITKEIMKPLTRRGARVKPDYKVIKEKAAKEAPVAAGSDGEVKTPSVPPEIKAPEAKVPSPVSEAQADEIVKRQEELIGTPRTAPSPTPKQEAAGLETGPVNTQFYDNDSLAATVKFVSESMAPDLKSRTVKSIYEQAARIGTPKKELDRIFYGIDPGTKIGNSAVATKMAGLQILHDANAKKIDDLIIKAHEGTLDEPGKYELRRALSQQNVILGELAGAKRDIAQAMNVFKGVDTSGYKETGEKLRQALDVLGGDDQLRAFAEKYISMGSQAKKNRLVERGLLGKTYDAMMYTAQSSALMNIDTHLYNLTAGVLNTVVDIPERALAVGISPIRKKFMSLFGKEANPDQYKFDDISARVSGFYNGLADGWALAADAIKTGTAKEIKGNPVSSEYFANTPIRMFGREIARIPEFKNSLPGRILDAFGSVVSVPMKALGAGDGIISGVAARMELHEQAARIGTSTYREAIAAGKTGDEAMAEAQSATLKLLNERPEAVEAEVNDFAKQATLQSDIFKEIGGIGSAYNAGTKFLNYKMVKPVVLFSKTIMNIADVGLARSPVAPLLSPRFHKEWKKGGRHRDLAMSRMAFGTGAALSAYHLAANGRITGAGPSDPSDRNVLKASGWQEFSMVLQDGEQLSPKVEAKLKKLLGDDSITKGIGEQAGKTFISLRRLEPATLMFLMGGAVHDAMKFEQADPDGSLTGSIVNATVAAATEYSSNFPQMQFINEMMSLAYARHEDGGERLSQILAVLGKAYSNWAISATPGANLANSALMAKIERVLDPTSKETLPTKDQAELAEDLFGSYGTGTASKAFFGAYNRMRSRIPFYNKGLPMLLDDSGYPVGDTLVSAMSPVRMTKGVSDEYLQTLNAFNHGPSRARTSYKGVDLTAEAMHRFKDLYANQIRINGITMKQAVVSKAKEMLDDDEAVGNEPNIGDYQNEFDKIFARYRLAAREVMFGKHVRNKEISSYNITPEPIDRQKWQKYGLSGAPKIEFRDLATRMEKEQEKLTKYGK